MRDVKTYVHMDTMGVRNSSSEHFSSDFVLVKPIKQAHEKTCFCCPNVLYKNSSTSK